MIIYILLIVCYILFYYTGLKYFWAVQFISPILSNQQFNRFLTVGPMSQRTDSLTGSISGLVLITMPPGSAIFAGFVFLSFLPKGRSIGADGGALSNGVLGFETSILSPIINVHLNMFPVKTLSLARITNISSSN